MKKREEKEREINISKQKTVQNVIYLYIFNANLFIFCLL